MVKRLRRKLADFIFWQWAKMSLLSARIYAFLFRNGDNGEVEDLTRYLGDEDNGG